ncbi:MAG: response regulator transcription factor [Alphaproteobacteria bacterium]|nr:response regulator transcription factor [Alphaproteobacteria bacterium]
MADRILIVDDDPDMRFIVRSNLELEGFDVFVAASGAALRVAIQQEPVDLVILDLGLPDEDGLDLAKIIRNKTNAGIIILTGKSARGDAVDGLKAGADDFVTKPFEAPELMARIHSVLSRTRQIRLAKPFGGYVKFEGWRFEGAYQRLTDPYGRAMTLTGVESRLLQILIDNVGRPVTREALHQGVRGRNFQSDGRSIDIAVTRLRRKLNTGGTADNLIKTVRGIGYEFAGAITHDESD